MPSRTASVVRRQLLGGGYAATADVESDLKSRIVLPVVPLPVWNEDHTEVFSRYYRYLEELVDEGRAIPVDGRGDEDPKWKAQGQSVTCSARHVVLTKPGIHLVLRGPSREWIALFGSTCQSGA